MKTNVRVHIYLTMFIIDDLNQWRHWPEHLQYRYWPAGELRRQLCLQQRYRSNLQRWRSLLSFYSFSSSSARINLLADQLNEILISPKSPFRFVCVFVFFHWNSTSGSFDRSVEGRSAGWTHDDIMSGYHDVIMIPPSNIPEETNIFFIHKQKGVGVGGLWP